MSATLCLPQSLSQRRTCDRYLEALAQFWWPSSCLIRSSCSYGLYCFFAWTSCLMEKRDEFGASPFGTRQADLNMSFKLAMRSLLTACSKQAFPTFTSAEQEYLHRLFIQVACSLHGNIEEEFESLCIETQVGTVLDTVEQLVEEQALDPLHSDKTNVVDVAQNVLTTKENEIQHLKHMLQRAVEQNQLIQARIEDLKKREADVSVMADAVEKLRRGSLNYGLHCSNMIPNP